MVVYRVIENQFKFGFDNKIRNEYIDYQNNIISMPSRGYIKVFNTHTYDYSVPCLHFFHFYEDAIQYISERIENNKTINYYIAYYEIPDNLLQEYLGFGMYKTHAYSEIPVLEYAIPFNVLENSFIIGTISTYCETAESEVYENYISGGYNMVVQSQTEDKQGLVLSLRNKAKEDN